MNKLNEKEILNRVLYKDTHIIVLNKPSGVPVHKGPKGGETMEDYFGFLKFGNLENPSLAHRLDRDTSGCLILGRHKKALKKLGKLFEEKKVLKTYIAMVKGKMPAEKGVIDAKIKKKSEEKRGWWVFVAEDGEVALTEYKVIKDYGDKSLVEFYPKTGRTHQIRVHAAHVGCPIIGDSIYGGAERDAQLMLHALEIDIPYTPPESITIRAEVPAYFGI